MLFAAVAISSGLCALSRSRFSTSYALSSPVLVPSLFQTRALKTRVRRHRVSHKRPSHNRLHHQVYCKPPPIKRCMSISRARAPDGVALPKVVQRGKRLLPVVRVHGVPAQELPTFV